MKLRHVRAVAVAVVVLVVLTGARKSDGGGCGNDNNNSSSTSSGSDGNKQNVDGPAGSDIRLLDCVLQEPGGRTMIAELEVRNGANVPYTYQAKVSFGFASAEGDEVASGRLVGFTVPAGQTRTTQVKARYGGSAVGETNPLCEIAEATKQR